MVVASNIAPVTETSRGAAFDVEPVDASVLKAAEMSLRRGGLDEGGRRKVRDQPDQAASDGAMSDDDGRPVDAADPLPDPVTSFFIAFAVLGTPAKAFFEVLRILWVALEVLEEVAFPDAESELEHCGFGLHPVFGQVEFAQEIAHRLARARQGTDHEEVDLGV